MAKLPLDAVIVRGDAERPADPLSVNWEKPQQANKTVIKSIKNTLQPLLDFFGTYSGTAASCAASGVLRSRPQKRHTMATALDGFRTVGTLFGVVVHDNLLKNVIEMRTSALTSNPVLVPVKPMRIRRQHSEVPIRDLATIEIRRRRRDAHIGIG